MEKVCAIGTHVVKSDLNWMESKFRWEKQNNTYSCGFYVLSAIRADGLKSFKIPMVEFTTSDKERTNKIRWACENIAAEANFKMGTINGTSVGVSWNGGSSVLRYMNSLAEVEDCTETESSDNDIGFSVKKYLIDTNEYANNTEWDVVPCNGGKDDNFNVSTETIDSPSEEGHSNLSRAGLTEVTNLVLPVEKNTKNIMPGNSRRDDHVNDSADTIDSPSEEGHANLSRAGLTDVTNLVLPTEKDTISAFRDHRSNAISKVGTEAIVDAFCSILTAEEVVMNLTKPVNGRGEVQNVSFKDLKLQDILIMLQGQLFRALYLIDLTRPLKGRSDIQGRHGDKLVDIGFKSLDGKLRHCKAMCKIDGCTKMFAYARCKAAGDVIEGCQHYPRQGLLQSAQQYEMHAVNCKGIPNNSK